MSTESLLQKIEIPMENLTSKELSKTEKLAMNNRRWIELSNNYLKETKENKRMCLTKITVASIAIPTFATTMVGLGYYALTNQLPLLACLAFYSSPIGSIASFICCITFNAKDVENLYHEKNFRLDPSQAKNVTEIFKEILNGNIKENCRIKEFGILSEVVYSKFKRLADKKKIIENEYSRGVQNEGFQKVSIEELTKQHNIYSDKIKLWNNRWNKFKPELEADLPDLNLLNQYSFDLDEIISV